MALRSTRQFIACAYHVAAMAFASVSPASPSDATTLAEPVPPAPELTAVMDDLLRAIESLTAYHSRPPLPPIHQLPQHEIEKRVCDEPCNVLAAYIPGDGIYLSAHLDPSKELYDRSVLLHELVHYLQQGHPKFSGMSPCKRERAKEEEAFAVQRAYLSSIGSPERPVFQDDFDCGTRSPN
ncbi:MAG TPA: hypothetical protein VFA81_07590 [Burkholderiales bacterium]|nr:hypothetical protein [Burkholderiales bacterium]